MMRQPLVERTAMRLMLRLRNTPPPLNIRVDLATTFIPHESNAPPRS